jgi:hypothetical protein
VRSFIHFLQLREFRGVVCGCCWFSTPFTHPSLALHRKITNMDIHKTEKRSDSKRDAHDVICVDEVRSRSSWKQISFSNYY